MNLVAYFFFLMAALAIWGWWRGSPHEGQLLSRFPREWVVVMCVAGGLFYIPTLRADIAAVRAGRAMSALVGQKVTYTCGSAVNVFVDRTTDEAAGYVRWVENGQPEKNSKLRYDLCQGLVDFLANPNDLRSDPREKIFAVHAVTHEARHMLGERNESAADCQAIQRNVLTAKALGASEASSRELSLAYYQTFYPRHPYATPDCKKGGALDENLPSSPWNFR